MPDTKQQTATGRPIEELQAGNAFRDTLVSRADGFANGHAPLWHGWALMDAFLAGIDYARAINAHDDMKAALEKLIRAARRSDSHANESGGLRKVCDEAEAALAKHDQVKPTGRTAVEILEDEKWRLENNFGHGSFQDGRNQERINALNAQIAALSEKGGAK
jgi:hypothetical protein